MQYNQFQGEVQTALQQAGLEDASIEIKGTATSFYSENPHKPLGHHFDANPADPADIDLGVASSEMIERMQSIGFVAHPEIPTFTRQEISIMHFLSLQNYPQLPRQAW